MSSPDSSLPQSPVAFEDWEALRVARIDFFNREVPPHARWLALIGMGIATGIEIAGRSASGILLPDMQGNAGATLDELSWVLVAYNTGYICSLGISAGFVRSFGIRRLWLVCLSLYALGTLLTFTSHDLVPLLIARGIAGLGGGVFLARSVLFLRELFPKSEVARAITLYNIIVFTIDALWPIAMGSITDATSWNLAFLLCLPFVVVAFVLLWRWLPVRIMPRDFRPPADYPGFILLVLAITLFQVAANRGERDLWFQSLWIDTFFFLSLVLFFAFFFWELRSKHPSPLFHFRSMLSQRTYTPAFALIVIVGIFQGAGLYIIPQYLRIIQPYNAGQTAVFFLYEAIGLFIGVTAAVWIGVPRLGAAPTAGFGFAIFGAVNFAFVYLWTPSTPPFELIALLFIYGCGLGLILACVSLLSTGSLDRRFQNDAATSFYLLRQISSSVGVTLAAVLIDQRMTFHSSRLLDTANRFDPLVQRTLAAFSSLISNRAAGNSVPVPGDLQLFQGLVVVQARLLSFIDISFCFAIAAIVAILVLAFVRWRQLNVVNDTPASLSIHR